MEFLKNLWAKIAVFFAAAAGILLYILTLKKREVNAYKAKIKLAETKDQVKDIEREILTKMEERKDNHKAIAKLEKNLEDVEKKKSEIAMKEGRDVEEYWRNN